MKLLTREEILQPGNMIMIYGETGVGKTTSILQSAPAPILYLQTEPRSLKPSIDAAKRPDLDVDVAVYQNFMGLMEFISDLKNTAKYSSVILDSLSHLSNVSLSSEIEDESFDAKSKDEKKKKPLINRTKLSMEGFGGLASNLFRLTSMLGKISQTGKVVIITCLLSENPKWDREIVAGPALKGREYPSSMPGFFDMIGLVESRFQEGKLVYPPLIQFASPDQTFMAKHTGAGKKTSGPLDISKILSLTSTTNN